MVIYSNSIDIVPGAKRVSVFLNQYDEDFRLVFKLYARTGELVLEEGTTAAVRGTKPDGNGYSADALLDLAEGTVTVLGDQQMTVVQGKASYELTLYKDGKELSTSNFTVIVERAALDKDTPTSRSQTRELVEIEDNAEELIAAANRAADVEQEIERLAAQVAGDANSAKEVARRALAAASNADNTANEAANQVDAAVRIVEAVRLALAGKIDGGYRNEDGYLVLTAEGEPVGDPIGPFAGGGGGGGGNNANLSVTNKTGWLATTVAEGKECSVVVEWSSLEDEIPTGDGTARINVNGTVRASVNVHQGEVEVELSPFLAVGANVVKLSILDAYGNSRTLNFSISVVAVSLASSFDASTPYQGTILFPYTPTGAVAKTVHFVLDGSKIGVVETSVSGRQMTYAIPQQSHGAHVLEAYITCVVDGQPVESNHLRFEMICTEPGEDAPIIVSPFDREEASQYETLNIPFTVYDPTSATAEVEIEVNGEPAARVTVDRTQHVFSYRVDEAGLLLVEIRSGSASKSFSLDVSESEVHVEAENDQLALYLSSVGRSNDEENPEEWTDAEHGVSAVLSGFNFASDGWQADADGNVVLRVAGDARVKIPYKPFEGDIRATGATIEVEFATHDVMDYDAPIISCLSGGRGFVLTAQMAKLMSEQSSLSMQYKEGERIRVTFVVEKRSQNRLVFVYVDGVMSGAVQYPATDDFSQPEPVGISIGSSDCAVDIYTLRAYTNNLERTQVLTNWIADTRSVEEMLERYYRNNIYDAYGKVAIANLPAGLPYMIIECPELPQYKGDKKIVNLTYVDPVEPARSFTATGVQIDVQGTSSQYYPKKNYKIKFKNGLTREDGTHVETYALRPGSIPTNAFCLKADVASSEGANNVELARLYEEACPYKTPAQQADPRVRSGIDGFPIVIFWSNGENTVFLQKANFNFDKGTPEVYGFTEGDESWEVKNNTSDRVLWKSDDYSGDAWLSDFEARFPEDYTDPTQLAEFAAFVKSTDTEQATNEPLPTPVEIDGETFAVDSVEYRIASFKAEIGNYVELESLLFYYLFSELFLMVDSRAKNLFPSFIGTPVAQEG